MLKNVCYAQCTWQQRQTIKKQYIFNYINHIVCVCEMYVRHFYPAYICFTVCVHSFEILKI